MNKFIVHIIPRLLKLNNYKVVYPLIPKGNPDKYQIIINTIQNDNIINTVGKISFIVPKTEIS